MAQRALFLVIDSDAASAGDWLAALLPQSRTGKLTTSAKSRQCLCHKAFFGALRGAGRVVCAFGNQWSSPLPKGAPPLIAGRQLLLKEPWDVFALWLPLVETDLASSREQFRQFLARLTPDIAVCAVLLNKSRDCRWFWRTQGDNGGALPQRPINDVLPTLLTVLEIPVPSALTGKALDLNVASKPSGYTPDEEREIQKRLEDLGYL